MCSQMMHFHLILIALPKEVDWGSHPMIWFSYGFSIDKTHSLLLLLRNKSLWRFSIESRFKIISNFSLSIKCIFFFCFYQSTIPFLPCHSVCRLGNWVGLCKTTSLVERLCSSRPHPKIRYMIRKILQSYKKKASKINVWTCWIWVNFIYISGWLYSLSKWNVSF